MQNILGMQEIFLLPKYVKQISRIRFLCNFALDKVGTKMLLKCIALDFKFSVVVLIHF